MPRPLLVVCATMLLLAAAPLPYGYYMLLRIVTCATLVAAAVTAHRRKMQMLATAFTIVALLFNPFVPVHLTKEIWTVIDIVTAVLLLTFVNALSRSAGSSEARFS